MPKSKPNPAPAGLSLLGKSGADFPAVVSPEILETFENRYPQRDYVIRFESDDFTSLCPVTGQPDFAALYIEYVADRLASQLGYRKIYSTPNPFDFMELISIESKVNFFERTNAEYALANKTMDQDVFAFNADF
jgi:hypothetical protein